jgi:hypothetical protein
MTRTQQYIRDSKHEIRLNFFFFQDYTQHIISMFLTSNTEINSFLYGINNVRPDISVGIATRYGL